MSTSYARLAGLVGNLFSKGHTVLLHFRFRRHWFAADGTPQALSFYNSAALKSTLNELVDFDLINRKNIRLSLGAVNVETGNSCYFDNHERVISVDHILASCALPPGFGPVVIDGQPYWDGGIVSNTPLWHVLDDTPNLNALIFQVDLFSAAERCPGISTKCLNARRTSGTPARHGSTQGG